METELLVLSVICKYIVLARWLINENGFLILNKVEECYTTVQLLVVKGTGPW